MEFQSSPYVAPLFIAAFIAMVLFVYAWRRRGTIGATPFAWTMFGMAFWAAVNALQWASADYASQVFWAKMRLPGTELLTVSFFIFSMQYTRQTKELKTWIKWLIYFPPVLTFLVAWTNEYHFWFWAEIIQVQLDSFTGIDFEFGPWFWFHTGFDYSLLAISVIQFTIAFFRSRHIYRGQLAAVLLGTNIAWVANMAYVFGLSPIEHLDLTPFGFIFGGIIMTAGFYRYQMLDVVSVSRDVIIQNMVTAVLITDAERRVIDVNPAAEALLGMTGTMVIGRSVDQVLDQWTKEKGSYKRIEKEDREEVSIRIGDEKRYYDLRRSPLQDVDGSITGYLYQMRDISDIKQSEAEKKNILAFLDELEEPYFEADLSGELYFVNKALLSKGEYEWDDIVGESFRRIIEPKQVRKIFEVFNQVYKTGQALSGVDFHYMTESGEFRFGEGSVSLVYDEEDQPVGFRGLIVDVTERVKGEEVIRETTHTLGERVKELNCLYGISALVETPDITLDKILQGTVDLIPPAWQYPEITCARLILGEQEFKTKNYAGSAWKMSADILVNGMKSGVVEVHYLDEMPDSGVGGGAFTKEERSLINAIAERLGQISERQIQTDRMTTLYQVGLATTSSLDMDAILVTIYEECHRTMNANVFFVALYDGKKDEIEYPIFFDKGKRLEPFRLPLDTGLGGWIIRNQSPFHNNDLVSNAEQLPIKMKRMGGEQTRSFIGVPLLGREGAIGAIAIQSYRAGVYNDADVQLLTTIAAQAAAAIENAQLYEAEQAAKDRLELQNKEIQEQKDLLDGLLQQSPIAMVINDMESKISVVNPAFEKLFGYSQEETIGKNIDDILSTPEILEEMRELTALVIREEIFVGGQRKRKDGLLVDVEMFAAPLSVRGEKFGYLVFYNDISERLKAEAELRQTQETFSEILDTLQDPYFEADKSGNIIFANDAFWKTVGFAGKEDIIGKNFRHFTYRKNVRDIFERFKVLYETRKPIEPFNYHYHKKDGSTLVAEIVASPIFEDDEVVGSRGIMRDVSIRVKAEEVLRQAKEAAEYRAGELATINRVADQVSSTLNMHEMLQSISREMVKIFNARNAGIGLLNEARTAVEIVAFYSTNLSESDATGTELPLKGNLATSKVLETKKTVVIENAQTDRLTESIHDLMKERGTKSLMIVPLLARGEVIGTIGMPSKDPDRIYSQAEVDLAETIASQIASAVENARLHEKTEEALHVVESDLEIGREIQSGFMPAKLPQIKGWEVAASFQPARQVGGDFFDAFQLLDGKIGVVMADVCDKGLGAALFMVVFRSLLRALTEGIQEDQDLKSSMHKIILSVNNYIAGTHGASNMFATMFFGILDPEINTLYYINGGHEPPLIVDQKGKIKDQLMPTGPAVGLLPDLEFTVEEFVFNVDDTLVCYTDGTTDAQSPSGEFFTEERLIVEVSAPCPSAFSLLKHIENQLDTHIANTKQFDDITLLLLRRKKENGIENHKITLPAKLEKLPTIKDFVEQASQLAGLDQETAFALILSVDEAVTNIITHGYKHNDPSPIQIAFEKNADQVKLVIIDHGTVFDPKDAPMPDLEADWDERAIGGLGLFLIQEMMDKVQYKSTRRKGNQLTLTKRLEPK